MDEEPKQRFIAIDFHILAYLGDFMKIFEAGVKQEISNIQKRQEPSLDGR
jgi:hypothetical protein